jgi:hypothetical protein
MADEPGSTSTETEDAPAPFEGLTPPVETPPEPAQAPAPDPNELLAAERLRAARLEGELQALRSGRQAPPAHAPAPLTRETIENEYARGHITDAQRIEALADLRADARLAEWRQRDVEDRTRADANDAIQTYVTKHPDLANAQSSLIQSVNAELEAMRRRNPKIDPKDPRDQLLAVERVLGKQTPAGPDQREWNRRRIAVGGGGGMTPETPAPQQKPKSKGEDIFDRLKPEIQRYFIETNRGDKTLALKQLEHADEAKLAKAGRFK